MILEAAAEIEEVEVTSSWMWEVVDLEVGDWISERAAWPFSGERAVIMV